MGTLGNGSDTLLLGVELLGTGDDGSVDDPVTTLAEVSVRHLDAAGSAHDLLRIDTVFSVDEVARLAADLEEFAAGDDPHLRFTAEEGDLEIVLSRMSDLLRVEARFDLVVVAESLQDDGLGPNELCVRFTTDAARVRSFADVLRRDLLHACRGRAELDATAGTGNPRALRRA